MKMSKVNENESTVQGRDTPVPVGIEVPRTGLARPSASNCPVPLVGDQAGAPVPITGTNVGDTTWERDFLMESLRESTPRMMRLITQTSPPLTTEGGDEEWEQASLPNVGHTDHTGDEADVRSKKKKRKRNETSTTTEITEEDLEASTKLQEKLTNLMEQMDKEVRKLAKTIAEHPNTKKEIKETAALMRSIMSQMTTKEMRSIMRTQGPQRPSAPGKEATVAAKDAGCQTAGASGAAKPESREAASQTDSITKEERDIKVTKEQVSAVTSYEEYRKLKKYEWPEEVYTVKHAEGIEPPPSHDLVAWDEGTKRSRQTRYITNKYPDLKDLAGKITYVHLTTKKVNAEGKVDVAERILTKIETDGTEEDCYDNLVEVKNFMVKNGRTTVALYPPIDERNGDTFGNMLECVFGSTSIKCTAYYTKERRPLKKTSEKNRTDAVIISRGKGQTYADLLRIVKEKIKNEKESTAQIKNIRQARGGNMVITVKPDQDKAGDLKGILTKGTDLTARLSTAGGRGRRTSLNIKGMDAVATKQEVKEAVQKATGAAEEEVRVGELRPYYGSSQAVTVAMQQEAADRILKMREIRIGYNWCTIRKRVNIAQCYKCWHYGHTAAECDEQADRGKDCRNCGRAGHKKRECNNEKHCPLCDRAGHCAGTGACPETRQALRKARRREECKEDTDGGPKEKAKGREEPERARARKTGKTKLILLPTTTTTA